MHLAGIDGCRGGWLCVSERDGIVTAAITPCLTPWLHVARPDVVVIDIPIGLADRGPRECDRLARRSLGRRGSSVFPAPVRGGVGHATYAAACAAHRAIDGRAISKQAWYILPKVAEVDALLQAGETWRDVLHEGHPELSFATWNGGTPMAQAKRTAAGRNQRRALVDGCWHRAVERLTGTLPRGAYAQDDLLDACAVLWTARRVAAGTARSWPAPAPVDATGLKMRIQA